MSFSFKSVPNHVSWKNYWTSYILHTTWYGRGNQKIFGPGNVHSSACRSIFFIWGRVALPAGLALYCRRPLSPPSNIFQLLLEDPQPVPGQRRYVILPEKIYPRVSSQLEVLGKPLNEERKGAHPRGSNLLFSTREQRIQAWRCNIPACFWL